VQISINVHVLDSSMRILFQFVEKRNLELMPDKQQLHKHTPRCH